MSIAGTSAHSTTPATPITAQTTFHSSMPSTLIPTTQSTTSPSTHTSVAMSTTTAYTPGGCGNTSQVRLQNGTCVSNSVGQV